MNSAREELDLFFTLSIDLLCIAGFDGYFKRLNPAWERVLGYSTEELLGRPFVEFVHPEDREATLRESERLVRGRETISFENRYRCKDGSYCWLSWNAAPQADARLIYATAHDLTRRRRNEQQVREMRQFLNSIIENLPITIFVKEAVGLNYVLFNKAAEEMIGFTRSQMLGKGDHCFFPEEQADAFGHADRQVLQSGKLLDIPDEQIKTHRGTRSLHTRKIPISGDAGRPLYLLGISEDITERKQAVEQLRRQNVLLADLARAEREASDALKRAQSQMVQTEKLAAMGQLIAGVAHEINNPLAFVSNNVAVLQREFTQLRDLLELYRSGEGHIAAGDPQIMRRINDIAQRIDLAYILQNVPELLNRSRDGLRRIQQIVSDLREFSRQETSGEVQQGVDLNAGIASTLNIVKGRARRSNVELRTELSDLPGIACQVAKINQVILNLVANAIDACGEGGSVTIRTRPAPDGGVEIRVIDTGSGIAPEIREKIFDPFFTTKPQGQGTGLGLSISHGIIADHGGRIEVESAPGCGTCFIVYLPKAKS